MKIKLCPLGHGKLQRMYSRKSEGLVNSWKKTKYWYCPVCQATFNETYIPHSDLEKEEGCFIDEHKQIKGIYKNNDSPPSADSIHITVEPDVYMKLQLHNCCGFGMNEVIDKILWKAEAYEKHKK
ncbi:MAG: hypothetical protein Q7J78_03300, partial [Clostridiales bacterium]|nr:hypothetical protein [Clostridiales bacterium]